MPKKNVVLESDKNTEETSIHLRPLFLYQLLLKHSDEDHMLTTPKIQKLMQEEYGIYMHRTTVPKDIQLLKDAGFEVMAERRQAWNYYISERDFSIPELKILIDAVQSSKFITEKKSQELVEKLLTLTSQTQAKKLKRHLELSGRVRSENEKGYYIVDAINDAINTGRRISFIYMDYTGTKKRLPRHNGEPYIVSPYTLIWDGDFYYLLGFNHKLEKIATFRVDRIGEQPEILEEAAQKPPKGFKTAEYTKQAFRMFANEEPEEVTLLCENSVMNGVIDKFGTGVKTKRQGKNQFLARVNVVVSPTFFSWVFQWEGRVKITGPEEVLEKYKEMLKKA